VEGEGAEGSCQGEQTWCGGPVAGQQAQQRLDGAEQRDEDDARADDLSETNAYGMRVEPIRVTGAQDERGAEDHPEPDCHDGTEGRR
jgi:hypothetical protein